jgi:hypothetical protein
MKSFLQHFLKILQWLLVAFLVSGDSDSIGYCPSRVNSIINHSINTDGVDPARTAVDKNGNITLAAPSSTQPSNPQCSSKSNNQKSSK